MHTEIVEILVEVLEGQLTKNEIEQYLEKPKYQHLGDVSFPCFTLAKKLRKSPQMIAQELAAKIKTPLIEEVQVVGGYLNLFLNKKAGSFEPAFGK